MKYLLIYLLVVCSILSVQAQKVRHPSLFYTRERIELAKQRIDREKQMYDAWQDILRKADGLLQRKDLNQVDYLALAYLMTDDTRYADKLKEILLDAVEAESWGNDEMFARTPVWNSELGLARKAFQCAIAYDAVYNDLSSSERKTIAQGLKRLALIPCLGDWLLEPTRIHSLNSMGHNWWTSCACAGGILALSLQNELPEAGEWVEMLDEVLPEWFDFAGDVLQQKPKTFDTAGGMYESLNYANFGIQEALLFRIAWSNMYPGRKPAHIPQLEKLPDYFIHVCYPRNGMLYSLNFGDSHKNVAADSSMMLLYALGMKNSNILWYLSQVEQGQHRDGYFLNRPLGLLYAPDLSKAPAQPTMKNSQLFADFGWATLRTSWQKDATMLAVKSGYTWNHTHADANSFILFHKGTDIIKDAGNCWYPNPAYRNYFFQSRAHNVVLFNGEGQSREQQYHGALLRGSLHHLLDAGNVKYVLANGTGPYADRFSRNFRHFLWIDNVIYMVDDLKTHDVGRFEWLWHPGGRAEKQGVDLNVTCGDASVVIRPLYPRMLAKSDFVHDYPDDLYWEEIEAPDETLKGTETYYSFHLPAKVDRVKGLTAIILKDTPADKELPVMERREGKDWIGLRVRKNGKITDLYINQLADGRLMHNNSWIEADGWSTDAYMFAVTYEEGAEPASAKDIFIAYGSALRRDTSSYFASLAKLFVILKDTPGRLKLWIDGQPRVSASFGKVKRPVSLQVNDKEVQVEYNRKTLKIKY